MARTAEVKKVGYTGRIHPDKLKALHELKWDKQMTFSELLEDMIDKYLKRNGRFPGFEKKV